MKSVVVQGLNKSFWNGRSETVPVFVEMSVRIDGPAVVAVVGPNGVGKTSFLRILAGLVKPDGGSVLINDAPPADRSVAYVSQQNPVFPWRRVADDIATPLEILGVSREERWARVREIVNRFSFDLPLERRTHGLSGGQRQMVNLCRALVGPKTPDLLLFDEPFSALDIRARQEFLDHLERVVVEVAPLIVITTHQLDLAVLASDSIIPFGRRPVTGLIGAPIQIAFPRPRAARLRVQAPFQETLAAVENAVLGVATK